MPRRISRWTAAITVAAAVVPGLTRVAAQPAAAAGPSLTVERVASLPSLIGTAPTAVTWAPDSRRVAFLWNDAGWPARDVWVANADGTGLRQLTMLRTPAPDPSGDATEALASAAAARADPGVTELLWTSAHHLLYVHRGQMLEHDVDAEFTRDVAIPADGPVSDVAMSPDGSRLAFLRGGDLWVMLRGAAGDAARPQRITDLGIPGIATVPLGTYNRADREVGTGVWGADWPPFAWSPDGQRIAFHAVDRRHIRKVPFPSYLGPETVVSEERRGYPGDENERRTLHVFDLATRATNVVPLPEPGRRGVSDYQWSPSGRLLIDMVSDTGTERWLYVVSHGGTAPTLVWHDQRDSRIYPAYVARWHPDGRRMLLVADLGEHDQLHVVDPDAATGGPKALTPAAWDVAGERGAPFVQAVPKTGATYFTGAGRNPYEREVYRLGVADLEPVAVTAVPGVHVPAISPDGRFLASIWSDDITPPQLLVGETQPGAPLRAVTSPPAEFGQYAWARPRYQRFVNPVDGFEVHARILEPPNLDRTVRHPVIFGPMYSNTVRNRWGGMTGTLQQYFVQRGYIVVQVDVRGSVGYGRKFREAFLMDYGGKDLDDVQAVVAGVATLPYVDRDRIGIWGTSYGGLLTAFALLTRPGMFAAGVAAAPALDPYAFGPDDVAITRDPATHPEAFVRGSALRLGGDLRDHLLIIHGLMDDVVPFRTTMALAERLMLLGKDFDVATAPAATHAWSAREHYAVFFYRKIAQYFDRYLKD